MPPTICKNVGSSKYAPLTNLSSQLQPIHLPASCVYKSSRQLQQQHQQQREQQQQKTKQLQEQNSRAQQEQPEKTTGSELVLKQEQPMMVPQPLSTPNSLMYPNPSSRPPSVSSMMGMGMSPNINAGMSNGMMGGQNHMYHHGGMPLRPGMSPISPANSGGPMSVPPPQGSCPLPYPSPLAMGGSPMNPMMNFRRTPIQPPPTYEMAVASPATSTTSSSYQNKPFAMDDGLPSIARHAVDTNALLVNVLLYDTFLNIFRDHNFDSCTICVCNAGPKCVGNIRGADSGVYLALNGSFMSEKSSSGGGGGGSNGYNNHSHGAFGMIDSPYNHQNHNQGHQNGYVDEDPINCHCGFSAVVNRRLAHRSGLFYEDEMEITGMAEDPAAYKKGSILTYILGECQK
jgi:mediator of RNA polymerase II transcription subunit 13